MSMPPKILPFKGLVYNQSKITDLSSVVTPPYDVISPEMQKDFYGRSPYNFVRVDLAQEAGDARYEAASKSFQEWIRENILVLDEKPALYFHHHTFRLPDGTQVVRKGFFGVRRLEDFSEGGIKPHEKTLEGPKADRLKLTRATKANLSPVFSLYSDAEKKIDRLVSRLTDQIPLFDFKTVEGDGHKVWRESDPIVCKFVAEALEQKSVFIADGHHRYETALNYRNERRKVSLNEANSRGDGAELFNYVLMYFSNMDDEGLVILPIHRAIHNLKGFDLIDFVKLLQKFVRVTKLTVNSASEITARLAEEGKDSHAFILVTKDPTKNFLMTLKRKEWLQSPVSQRVPKALVGLDVTVLHRLIFEEILRISPEAQANQENIIYWKDTTKAINETHKGGCEVTFLLNPTRIEDMRTVAMAGEKMPQKSTYFYPKVPSGLVIYPL